MFYKLMKSSSSSFFYWVTLHYLPSSHHLALLKAYKTVSGKPHGLISSITHRFGETLCKFWSSFPGLLEKVEAQGILVQGTNTEETASPSQGEGRSIIFLSQWEKGKGNAWITPTTFSKDILSPNSISLAVILGHFSIID